MTGGEGFKIEKLSYSAYPWRVLTPDGKQIWVPTVDDNGRPDHVPLGGATKTAAVAALGRFAYALWTDREGQVSA